MNLSTESGKIPEISPAQIATSVTSDEKLVAPSTGFQCGSRLLESAISIELGSVTVRARTISSYVRYRQAVPPSVQSVDVHCMTSKVMVWAYTTAVTADLDLDEARFPLQLTTNIHLDEARYFRYRSMRIYMHTQRVRLQHGALRFSQEGHHGLLGRLLFLDSSCISNNFVMLPRTRT